MRHCISGESDYVKNKEETDTKIRGYALLFLFSFIVGCSPVISVELREKVDSSVAFRKVQENPDAYTGKTVLWGGDIIQTFPEQGGTTLVEVLRWPLGWWDEPRETVAFHGRFLVLVKEDSNPPPVFKERMRMTVAGEIEGGIQGSKIKELSDPTYEYPVIRSKELYVWKHSLYRYSTVPDEREIWRDHHFDGILNY